MIILPENTVVLEFPLEEIRNTPRPDDLPDGASKLHLFIPEEYKDYHVRYTLTDYSTDRYVVILTAEPVQILQEVKYDEFDKPYISERIW